MAMMYSQQTKTAKLDYRIIRIEIRLTKAQQIQAMNILSHCHRLWNLYVERAKQAKENKQYIPNNYEFDKIDYRQRILPSDPEYWKQLPSKARRDLIDTCYASFKHIKEEHGWYKLRFRSWYTNPVKSFFFIKDGIRLIDDSHMWIPILRVIKLKEKWNNRDAIDCITSGRILYEKGLDKWYVCFRCLLPITYGAKPWFLDNGPISGMGIDLGIKRHMTIWNASEAVSNSFTMELAQYDPEHDEKLIAIDEEIDHLNRIIDRKIQFNKIHYGYKPHENGKKIAKEHKRPIYNSHAIQKLRKRVSKLYAHARNHKRENLRRACNTLARFQPEFICMESLNTSAMIAKSKADSTMGHDFRRRVAQASFYATIEWMKWTCQKYQIPFIQADDFYPSSQLCSSCGHQQKLTLRDRTYKCKECGQKMDRDLNAAKNLFQYGYQVIHKIAS